MSRNEYGNKQFIGFLGFFLCPAIGYPGLVEQLVGHPFLLLVQFALFGLQLLCVGVHQVGDFQVFGGRLQGRFQLAIGFGGESFGFPVCV